LDRWSSAAKVGKNGAVSGMFGSVLMDLVCRNWTGGQGEMDTGRRSGSRANIPETNS
jgi:hypothetical protein